MINPATLKALADGDIENAIVAATPGGIEAQEAAGQAELVASTNMPKDMSPSREAYEKVGFEFGDEVDDIFISAKLPAGWTRKATDHSMWSEILDDQGRKRISIFYKAAFYDRNANCHMERRFSVRCDYPEDWDADREYYVADQGEKIHSLGMVGSKDWDGQDKANQRGVEWLKSNWPEYEDPTAYWAYS